MKESPENMQRILLATLAFYVYFIFEGIILRQNSSKLINTTNPHLVNQSFDICWGVFYTFNNAIRAIFYNNIGSAILYYILLGFVIYRKSAQATEFSVGTLYILQWVILGLVSIWLTYVFYFLYRQSIWKKFKLLGANKRLINAYVIRNLGKSMREAFIFYFLLLILYLTVPEFAPGLYKFYKPWKLVYFVFVILTSFNEDDENRVIKVISIIGWFLIFLDTLLERFVKSLVLKKSGFATDTYLTIVLFIYLCVSCVDLYLYGSGLKEFQARRNEPRTKRLE